MNHNLVDELDACLLATTYGEPLEVIEKFVKYHANLCDQSEYSVELTLVFEKSENNKARLLQNKLELDYNKKLINIIVSDKNPGFPACLNYGLANTRADYIIRIDTDDICRYDRLDKQIKTMKCQNVDICYSYMKTRSGHILRYPTSRIGILRDISMGLNPIPHPASCIRKSTLLQAGGYSEKHKKAEDFELWLKIMLTGKCKFFCIKEPLIIYNTERALEKDDENALAQINIRLAYAGRVIIMILPIISGIIVNTIRLMLPNGILLLARRWL